VTAFTDARRWIGPSLLVSLLLPGRTVAQSHFEVSPSLGLFQMYDDNLFATPRQRTADFIWRISPRVGVDRRSSHLRLHGQCGIDAEVFREHPELDALAAGQQAALGVDWRPSPRATVSVGAAYVSAPSAEELNTVTGLQVGRQPARQLSSTASFSRQLGARTKATLDHQFTRQRNANDPHDDTHAITAALERRLRRRDVGRWAYSARRYAFGADSVVAHVVTFGWRRELTPRDHIEIEAGPRWTGPALGAEAAAAFRRTFRTGEAELRYLHTETAVFGEPGPALSEGVAATVRGRLGALHVGLGPSFFRVHGRSESMMRRAGVDVRWGVTRRLALSASHQLTLQKDTDAASRAVGTIVHNVLVIGMTTSTER
jgi:hypothetical protein